MRMRPKPTLGHPTTLPEQLKHGPLASSELGAHVCACADTSLGSNRVSMPSRRSQGAATAANAEEEPPRTPGGGGAGRDDVDDVNMEEEGGRGGECRAAW